MNEFTRVPLRDIRANKPAGSIYSALTDPDSAPSLCKRVVEVEDYARTAPATACWFEKDKGPAEVKRSTPPDEYSDSLTPESHSTRIQPTDRSHLQGAESTAPAANTSANMVPFVLRWAAMPSETLIRGD